MLNDGPKRKGRFLKGNSRVLEKVALSDFSFGSLDETEKVTPDNAVRNIIHAKYHEADVVNVAFLKSVWIAPPSSAAAP